MLLTASMTTSWGGEVGAEGLATGWGGLENIEHI